MVRARWAWVVLLSFVATAHAGTVTGRLDLPPAPSRPPPAVKGFLDRVENPLAPVKPVSLAQDMVIVLEGGEVPMSPPQVVVELLGESFSRRVVAAPAGAEVLIKNVSKMARTLVAAEDPKLVPQGPINPTGPKSFRVSDAGKVYTIGDKDAPHLKLKVVVVSSQNIGYPDDSGRFEIDNVPAGSYKVKVWYRDGWLSRDDETITVGAKGKTDVNPKVPASAIAPAAKK
ncbi:MAG TPA: hypothetical protein VFS15_07945 [Kofleriaceae bacterium]|nr:hypothetical protein [Kofleriaceae bacterium]